MTRPATWLGVLVSVVVLGVGAEARGKCVRSTAEVQAWPEGTVSSSGLVAPEPAPHDGMRWTAALTADEPPAVATAAGQERRWEGLYGFGLVALSFLVRGWWLVTGRLTAGAVKE